MAWNNVLLLPLAALGVLQLRWRTMFARDASIVLPLTITCILGLLLLVYQGHGWGYRYLHGLIGAFCLLGGFGWMRLSRPESPLSLNPIWLSVGFAVLASAFLTVKRSEEHTSELQSLMRISYAVFCLKKKNYYKQI